MTMVLLGLASLGLVSCRGGDTPIETPAEQHDSSAWFTEEELAKVGLSGLTCPTGCTGEISTSVSWFNGGYSFSQVCEDQAILETNAQAYYSYFSTNYASQFGKEKLVALSADYSTTYYRIVPAAMNECYSTNPSARYTFYYVRDAELEDRYLKQNAVWSFDIRYEATDGVYQLKIFVENASLSRNGTRANFFNL